MKRARDEPTGATLWHTKDGGRLYMPRDSGYARLYYFCATCDAEGREPYVPYSQGGFRTETSSTREDVQLFVVIMCQDCPEMFSHQDKAREHAEAKGHLNFHLDFDTKEAQ